MSIMYRFFSRSINLRAWMADGPLKQLFRQAGVVLTGDAGASLLGLVSLSVTARALGPGPLGVLVLLKAYAALMEKLATFQSWQALIAHGARFLEQHRRAEFCRLIKFGTLLDLSGAALGAAGGMAAAYAYGQWRGWDAEQIRMTVWYSATICSSLNSTPKAVLRLFGRFHRIAVHGLVAAAVKLIGVTAVLLSHGGLRAFLAVWIVAEVFGNLLLLGMGWHELRRQEFRGVLASPVRGIAAQCPGLWGFVWTTNFNSTVKGVAQEADTLVVGAFLGSGDAGLYKVARQCAQAIWQLAEPLNQVLFPEVAKLWAKEDLASIRRLLRRLGLAACGAVACVWLGVVVLGRPFLSFAFGPAFVAAHPVLVWQLIGVMVLAGSSPLAAALPATGEHRAAFHISLIGLACYLPLLAILMGTAGLVGAGAAYALHELVKALLLLHRMRWALAGTPLAMRVTVWPRAWTTASAGNLKTEP